MSALTIPELQGWLAKTVAGAYHGVIERPFDECGDPFCVEGKERLDQVYAAIAASGAAGYGWHADGDLCLGSECLNIDENTGDHSTDIHSDDWWEGYTEHGRRFPAEPSR